MGLETCSNNTRIVWRSRSKTALSSVSPHICQRRHQPPSLAHPADRHWPPEPGADSRTTTGAYIANRVTDKLTQVHDTIWCCRSGSAADTQAVADIVKYQLELFAMTNRKAPTTQTAAAIFQEITYSNKDRLS